MKKRAAVYLYGEIIVMTDDAAHLYDPSIVFFPLVSFCVLSALVFC